MTEEQFIVKFKEIAKEQTDDLIKEGLRLFKSGGVDTSQFKNNYLLPNIIMAVALDNEINQYRLLKKEQRVVISNLKYF